MTKYILHGGGEMKPNKKHDNLFQEIIKDLPDQAKVLLVYFAIPDEDVISKHSVYEDYFKRNGAGKKIELKIASYDDFVDEIEWADAIYFRGGDTFRLLGVVSQFPNIKKDLAKKKIVAGSSAGVYFLSNYSYSRSRKIIYKGLGILPIKTNCHYTQDKKDVIKTLEKYPGKLVLLKEGDYEVIIQ